MAVDISELLDAISEEGRRVRDEVADDVLASARDDAPVSPPSPTNDHSGQLRDSLEVVDFDEGDGVFTFAVVSDLDYAQFTDDVDTSPHEIVAVNARFLRFWWENGPGGPDIYYFTSVQHPGTHGQHWFGDKMQDRVDDALRRVA